MNFEPLLHAPLAIQIHVATVLPAAIIGLLIFMRRKGTRLHKVLGRLWVMLMIVTAISSFFIHQINLVGGFSPIHILSILVLLGCARAVAAARRGQIEMHRRIIKSVYLGGILGAGFFAFMPGRIMNEVAFPYGLKSPFLVACLLMALVAASFAYRNRKSFLVPKLLRKSLRL
ncbi:DUF2306 domain-containing protein [Brucella anthropi]|uniref:DUF2306 domain-containing protein n=1 Tax=Brucella anthropi TaxID=529 RepID=UPI00077501AD|nr:DUF2306 domain-containing protein [Brucella anthropi]KXO76128.1 hypothetical protein AYJ56_05525 [Brucella anthropi]